MVSGGVCDRKVAVGLGRRISHWLGTEVSGIIRIRGINYRVKYIYKDIYKYR